MKMRLVGGLLAAQLALVPTLQAIELDTQEKKVGYMIGMDIGRSLKEQGEGADLEALIAAIRDAYTDQPMLLTPEEAQAVRQEYVTSRQAAAAAEQAAAAAKNGAESVRFLEQNASQEGVATTASGLQYKVVTMGTGAKPLATQTVKVHYRGTLINGEEFDSSHKRGEPVSFPLDRVIKGWTEGVQLMPVGSKFMFFVPPELGYGEAGGGPIPPNAALIFEIELLEIVASEG